MTSNWVFLKCRATTFRLGWLALFLTVLIAGSANAGGASDPPKKEEPDFATMSLDELRSFKVPTVVGASKHEQKITEAPSSVTIVTRDDIQKSGYRTLAEILESVPGLYTQTDRNFSLLGIRGFSTPGSYNTKFQVLLDGHRMNDAVSDRPSIDNGFALDVDLIERVEVIRGPGSSLYGDSAFFGVINVITRRGRDISGVETSVTGGDLGTGQGAFRYGNVFSNGVEMVFSGSYGHSDGNARLFYPEFNTPLSNNGIAYHRDGEEFWRLFSSVSWQDFAFEAGYTERIKHVPTASFGTVFNDPRNQMKETVALVDLKYEHQFADELDLLARVGFDRGTTVGTYIYDNGLPDLVPNIDEFLSERVTLDLQLRRNFFGNNTVTAGAALVENLKQNQKNFDTEPDAIYLNDRRHGLDYAFFLQDEFQVRTNLILNGGFRYDHFDTFGGTINPRLALIYRPWERSTFKFIYGTAFRAPSANEMYYSDGGISQVPSPFLKPETVTSYELVAEHQLDRHLSASASGFYYTIKDLIQETTLPVGDPNAGAIQLNNLGSAHAKGLELSLKGAWEGGYEARTSYSLTDARDGTTGARLVNSPVHLFKANLTVPVYRERVFATLEWLAASDRITLTGQRASSFGIANFTLFSRRLVRGLEMSASIYNLFDTSFKQPGGPEHVQDLLPQDGRTFRVKLTYKF